MKHLIAIVLLSLTLAVSIGCGPSERKLQQQAAQKAEAVQIQHNKEAAAKEAADVAEETAYQAALAKREQRIADCKASYPNGEQYIYPGKDYPVTKEVLEDGETRRPNPRYSLNDGETRRECEHAAYNDDSPENRTIKAESDRRLERDQQHIQAVLASDPYAFCGMVEGAACRPSVQNVRIVP